MVNIWSILQLSVSIVTDSQSMLDEHRLHHSATNREHPVSVGSPYLRHLFMRCSSAGNGSTQLEVVPQQNISRMVIPTLCMYLNCRCNYRYPFCHLSLHCYVPVFSRTWSSSWWARWFCFCNSIFQRANQSASYSYYWISFQSCVNVRHALTRPNLYQSLWYTRFSPSSPFYCMWLHQWLSLTSWSLFDSGNFAPHLEVLGIRVFTAFPVLPDSMCFPFWITQRGVA